MKTRYNPNYEETELILTTEEMRDNDISIRAVEIPNCNICPDYRYIGHGLYECNAYGECPYIKKKKKKRRISNG